jgi:cytochrome b subunit of formate dehydrogenase
MEFWRRASNPWGQEVLIGIAWDLMWAALIAGVAFTVGHALYTWLLAPKEKSAAVDAGESAGVPERVLRHGMSARVFHWLMSLSMFVLLVTAFFPVIGIQFAWVTVHWIAGVALILMVVYHVVHSIGWQDLWSMWIDKADIKEGTRELTRVFTRSGEPAERAGKYPVDRKLYHHIIAVVTLAAIGTGVLMMFRVDTWFWQRNPYILSDGMWGVMYVLHGISGVSLITLVIAHIYFAIRPEKWWITMSMINGWIGRKEYLEHHDPKKWVVKGSTPPAMSGGAAPLAGVTQDKRSND